MITSFFLALALLQSQQADPQLQRQQQEMQQLERRIEEQQNELSRLVDALNKQTTKPVCLAELQIVNGAEPRRVPGTTAAFVSLNLTGTVSKPANPCLPAEIRLTASYLDGSKQLICSGVIENLAVQSSAAQNINLDVRPWNLREFARWRNEPPETSSGSRRLVCINPEGLAEVTSEEFKAVQNVRIQITSLPSGGGLASVETQIDLQH